MPVPSAAPAYTANYQNTITVNSSETVSVTPDIAQLILAVRTEASNASDCHKQNTEDVNKVINQLKELGIGEKSIQTSDYYMYPIYNYSGKTQKITGYEASSSLTVSDLPIDQLGEILTKTVSAGINNIQSITYQSSTYDEAYCNALKLAMESAGTKAKALAEAGNCSLGSVANIYENSNYSEARYTDNTFASKMMASGAMEEEALYDTSANIMPGEIEVEVAVTVEYILLP